MCISEKVNGFLKANGMAPPKAISKRLDMEVLLENIDEIDERIRGLALRLEELRASLPAHSVKPEMLMAIEETEEELEDLRRRRREFKGDKHLDR